MNDTPITHAQCNPYDKGCVALAEAKAQVIQERTDLLSLVAEKLDTKAYSQDVKEILDKIDRLKTLVITSLVTLICLLVGVVGDIIARLVSSP
jgi:hypothetical protein